MADSSAPEGMMYQPFFLAKKLEIQKYWGILKSGNDQKNGTHELFQQNPTES